MIVRELLTTALERANDTAQGHTPNARDLEHARKIFNGRLKKYCNNNLLSVYQKVKTVTCEDEEFTVGNKFEGKNVVLEGVSYGKSNITAVKDTSEIDTTIGAHANYTDVFFDESQEVSVGGYSPFYYLQPGSNYTRIRSCILKNDGDEDVGYGPLNVFKYGTHNFSISMDQQGSIPAHSTANITLLYSADTVSGIAAGDKLYRSGDEDDIYIEVLSTSTIELGGNDTLISIADDEVSTFVAVQPDVYINDIQKIVAMNYKNSMGIWKNLDFRNLSNFWVDTDDEIYACNRSDSNTILVRVKLNIVGKILNIIYDGNVNFQIDDFIDLPPEYEELLTQAVIVELLVDDESSDQNHVTNAKAELQSLEDQIESNNAGAKMMQREAEIIEEDRYHSLFSGSFLRRRR